MKRRRRGSLRSLFEASNPFVKEEGRNENGSALIPAPARAPIQVVPDEIIRPCERQTGLSNPGYLYRTETVGAGFSDTRVLAFSTDGESWKMTVAWRSEGVGEPPPIVKEYRRGSPRL